MKYVTRKMVVTNAKVKIMGPDGKVKDSECMIVGEDILKELKLQYPDSKIIINEMTTEENNYRMPYEFFVKYGELVK